MTVHIERTLPDSTYSRELTLLAEQTSQSYAALNNAIIAMIINASILVAVQWPVISHEILIVWLVAVLLSCLIRGITAYIYKNTIVTDGNIELWSRRYIIGSLFGSLVWGSVSIWLFPADDLVRQVFLAFVIGGMAAGAVSSLSFMKLTIYSYLGLSLTPLIIQFGYSKSELSIPMTVMLMLYLVMLLLTAKRAYADNKNNILLRNKVVEREKHTRQSELNYRSLFELSDDANMTLDKEGFIDCNQSTLRMFGFASKEEFLGKHPSELSPALQSDGTESRIAADERIATAYKEGKNFFEWTHQRANGDEFPAEVLLTPMNLNEKDVLLAVVRDITKRKRFEHDLLEKRIQLQDAEERNRLILESAGEGIYGLDLDGNTTFVNIAACEMLGFTAEELIGQPMHSLIHHSYPDGSACPRESCHMNTAFTDGKIQKIDDEVLWRKDGSCLPVEYVSTPVRKNEKLVGAVVIFRDNSEKLHAEQKLLDAKEAAEKANKIKSQFLSSMSHELRTPMNAIMGFSQLLKIETESPLNQSQQENVDEITRAGKHLLELINEVLDLARIEAGHIDLSIEPVALAEVVTESLQLITPLAQKRGIEINLMHDDIGITPEQLLDSDYAVRADHTRLKQVLLNLLTNAVKYNCENGKITISFSKTQNKLTRVSIKDTGAGLASEQQAQLFEAFNRLDAKQSDIEGTGIGLVIARNIVELMGGSIGVDSQPGEGSTFWFELPSDSFYPRQKTANEEQLTNISQTIAHGEHEHTVLYIEDNPANLRLVAQLLGRCDSIHMWSAHEPLLGLELAVEHNPDLILLDINLPGMDGYEVLKQLRQREVTRDTPVIAISANAMPKDIQKGKEAGFDDYITKPIDVEAFLSAIDVVLTQSDA